ncbi:hypothetical protein NGB36_14770 [Streptomyces sp. RB6PN25]|uniref:HTH marR-type domain-containing protein n=1 Tax=Streptomyces humicola TaxID=2953240 RepID=A0ABT1PVY7_9ACTN|nr:hypothetical protein [Streptomyces humicola]MCQ4081836.1 hypothetical protein [Streptomyces humicola]
MSTLTHQPETPSPTTPDPTALTGAQARLWAALTRMPGATAAELATTAQIGRSTAGKTLTALETSGMTHRHPGGFDGKRRLPDRWYATTAPSPDVSRSPDSQPATTPHCEPQTEAPSATAQTAADVTQQPPTAPEPEPSPDRPTITSVDGTPESSGQRKTPPEPRSDTTTPHTSHDGSRDDHGTQAPTAPLPTTTEQPDGTPTPAPSPEVRAGDDESSSGSRRPAMADETVAAALAELVSDGQAETDTAGDDSPPFRATAVYGGKQRRAPGELRSRVLTFLRDRPGEEWGPTGLSRQLGASSGAISNALDRLVALGLARRTGEKPRRFTAATADEHDPQSQAR